MLVFVCVREVNPPPHDRVQVFQVLQALILQLTGEQLRLRRLLHHAFEGVKTTRIVPIARITAAHPIMNGMERFFFFKRTFFSASMSCSASYLPATIDSTFQGSSSIGAFPRLTRYDLISNVLTVPQNME